jgi:hypothetical protein
MIDSVNTYVVHSHSTGADYYVASLGTDHICILKAKGLGKIPLCIPYSAIAGINYY